MGKLKERLLAVLSDSSHTIGKWRNRYSQRRRGIGLLGHVAENDTDTSRIYGSVSDQIVTTVENSEVHRQLQDSMEEKSVVDEVARILSSTLDIDRVYEHFAYEVKKLVDYDRIVIHVIDEHAGTSIVKYRSGIGPPGSDVGVVRRLRDIRSRKSVATGKTVVVNDLAVAPEFPLDQQYLEAGLNSLIVVPLVTKTQVVGAISLRSRQTSAYGKREQTILERLANQIAPAIENTRRFEESIQTLETLRQSKAKKKLAAAFGVALLLIAITGTFSWSSTVNLVDNAQMVNHTHQVLENLARIVSQLKDAETGQRGFVITGEPRYLEPYNAGIAGVELAVANARKLTPDNPSHQSRLDVIEPLIQRKLDELSQTIDLRRDAGFESALEVVLTDAGKRTMDDLRVVIAEMEQEERQLLEQRAAATASTVTKTKFAVVFGTIVSTAIFGIIALFLSRTNSKLDYEVQVRKRAEKGLDKQAQELARSNHELEQFAHIASHDLQEPLRMVSSYTQLLERRYKDKLDSDANEFIGYAVDGAKRMQTLINDLLAYSRITTQGNLFEAANCSDIFENAVTNLTAVINESGATVTRDPLPTLPADASQLVSVFQNLIGNGIKYHGDQPPLIHVSAVESGDGWLFSFKDNGIGIEAAFAERVFVIFQRLHGKTKYAGSGIGLAICKKVIERHGGRIWVESEPQKGSTFYFTLPKRDQREEKNGGP